MPFWKSATAITMWTAFIMNAVYTNTVRISAISTGRAMMARALLLSKINFLQYYSTVPPVLAL